MEMDSQKSPGAPQKGRYQKPLGLVGGRVDGLQAVEGAELLRRRQGQGGHLPAIREAQAQEMVPQDAVRVLHGVDVALHGGVRQSFIGRVEGRHGEGVQIVVLPPLHQAAAELRRAGRHYVSVPPRGLG